MKIAMIILTAIMVSTMGKAQNFPHYTMFMFNKLLYNPAYAGNKDITTVNMYARRQWVGLEGAPQGVTISIHGPVGNYMKPFRKVAVGMSVNVEKAGVTQNTNVMGYYAYRIQLANKSVLSMGLQATSTLYSADYQSLNPYHQNDPNINYSQNISNRFLPNFGGGLYYSGKKIYVGFSVPFILQNKYNKNEPVAESIFYGQQIRTYFASAGYVFTISDAVKLQPQALARYAANSVRNLPFNADFNLSCFFYERFMVGATYRTDKSMEGVLFMQATTNIYIGYSYNYTLSGLRNYNHGTHEITLGFDFIKDRNKYMNPRLIKLF